MIHGKADLGWRGRASRLWILSVPPRPLGFLPQACELFPVGSQRCACLHQRHARGLQDFPLVLGAPRRRTCDAASRSPICVGYYEAESVRRHIQRLRQAMQRPGLYYPYIHVRDEAWLKAAALYWPSIRRLVPNRYRKHDNPTAYRLAEAQVLRDEDTANMPGVGTVVRSLRANAHRLTKDYNIERALTTWNGQAWSEGSFCGSICPELAWIHVSKISLDTVDYLTSLGLALPLVSPLSGSTSSGWIGLHPTLAGVYMTALAVRISEEAQFCPLTDQVELRITVPNRDEQSAMRLLLGRETDMTEEIEPAGVDTYVMLAMQYAIPKNIVEVPVDDIIKCREELAEELQGFQDYVNSRQAELTELAAIPDGPRHLEAFTDYVEHTIDIPLMKLEKGLALHKLEPARSLFLTGTFVPPAAAATALSAVGATPAMATATGTVTAIGNAWWQIANVRRAARSNSPVAYILDVRDRLTPRTLNARIRRIFRGTYGQLPVRI